MKRIWDVASPHRRQPIIGFLITGARGNRLAIPATGRFTNQIMPSPRDITGDLVRLRGRKPLQDEAAPETPDPLHMRAMAFDPVLWISGVMIVCGLAVQGAFIIWMW